jgi:putative ABC transport system permease protein
MSPWENVRISQRAIRANLLRSALTMLGIVIGVAAVIALVAIGSGAQKQVAEQIGALGANLILVQPGSSRQGAVRRGTGSRQTLTEQDADAIAFEVPGVLAAAPTMARQSQIVRGNLNWSTFIGGVTPSYLFARDWRVDRGRALTPEDIDTAAKVAVLGGATGEKLFEGADPVGQSIRIANVPFTVVGVLSAKGQSASSGQDQDDVALVPLTSAKLRVLGARNQANRQAVDFILIKAASAAAIPAVHRQTQILLRARHRLAPDQEDDFSLSTPSAAMEAQAAATRSVTLFLAAVASVSLVVGGIGIMNIMLVSVTERTREIGLRQALGARRRDVRNQFLMEAVMLCLTGGVAGVVLGVAAGFASARIAGWPIYVTPAAVVMAFAFSGTVGIFFGYYPARKASRLDPIEALRFE